jgi:hypothetical protein
LQNCRHYATLQHYFTRLKHAPTDPPTHCPNRIG